MRITAISALALLTVPVWAQAGSLREESPFLPYRGVDTWLSLEIRVTGNSLTVLLEGEVVTTAQDLDNVKGHLGFQSEKGTIEFRNMKIHEH